MLVNAVAYFSFIDKRKKTKVASGIGEGAEVRRVSRFRETEPGEVLRRDCGRRRNASVCVRVFERTDRGREVQPVGVPYRPPRPSRASASSRFVHSRLFVSSHVKPPLGLSLQRKKEKPRLRFETTRLHTNPCVTLVHSGARVAVSEDRLVMEDGCRGAEFVLVDIFSRKFSFWPSVYKKKGSNHTP